MTNLNNDISSKNLKIITFLFNNLMHDFSNKLHIIIRYTELIEEISQEENIIDEIYKLKETINNTIELLKSILLFKIELENKDVSKLNNEDMSQLWLKYKNKYLKK